MSELLDAWRDASLAAVLAERLALVAESLTQDADTGAAGSEEMAALAERVAESSSKAAQVARAAADRAASLAVTHHGESGDADQRRANASDRETRAKNAFDDTEDGAGGR